MHPKQFLLYLAQEGDRTLMDVFICPVYCEPHLMVTCRQIFLSQRFLVLKEEIKELIVVDSDSGPQESLALRAASREGLEISLLVLLVLVPS